MRFGAALRPDASVFWSRLQRDVLPLVTCLPASRAVSTRAGDIAAAQRLAGRPCGTLDPLIAATALVQGSRSSPATCSTSSTSRAWKSSTGSTANIPPCV